MLEMVLNELEQPKTLTVLFEALSWKGAEDHSNGWLILGARLQSTPDSASNQHKKEHRA